MTRAIGRSTGPTGHRLTMIKRMTAKWTLINFTFFSARERHTIILKFNNRWDGITTHVFNGVLIAQPIRSFDSIIHVKLPVIAFTHII